MTPEQKSGLWIRIESLISTLEMQRQLPRAKSFGEYQHEYAYKVNRLREFIDNIPEPKEFG